MNAFENYVSAGMDRLAMELLVRSYFDTINQGTDASGFFAEEVVFRPSIARCAEGRHDVIEMLGEIRDTFEEWHTDIISLATGDDFVLAECVIHLKLVGNDPGHVLAFSYLRIRDGRISEWHQLTG